MSVITFKNVDSLVEHPPPIKQDGRPPLDKKWVLRVRMIGTLQYLNLSFDTNREAISFLNMHFAEDFASIVLWERKQCCWAYTANSYAGCLKHLFN